MSQAHLALAVRDAIRGHADYSDKHCNVEWEELAPSTAPDVYVIVKPGPVVRGPSDNATMSDRYHGIDVSILMRSPKKPRDMKRDLWLQVDKGFTDHVRNIESVVDYSYTIINNANTQMITDGFATGNCDEFIEPLHFESLGPIRRATSELLAARQGEAGLIRTIHYREARRLVARSP